MALVLEAGRDSMNSFHDSGQDRVETAFDACANEDVSLPLCQIEAQPLVDCSDGASGLLSDRQVCNVRIPHQP